MLSRKSGQLSEDFYHLTFGGTSLYLLVLTDKRTMIFDGGCSAHVALLMKRLASVGLEQKLPELVFVTTLFGGRSSALHSYAGAQLLCPAGLHSSLIDALQKGALPASDSEYSRQFVRVANLLSKTEMDCSQISEVKPVPEGVDIELDGRCTLRIFESSGVSAVYLSGIEAVIAPPEFGLYSHNGCSVPLPAEQSAKLQPLVEALLATNFQHLCLPFEGVLSAKLAREFLSSLLSQGRSVEREVAVAREAGVASEEIASSIREIFRSVRPPDPLLQRHRAALESAYMSSLGLQHESAS